MDNSSYFRFDYDNKIKYFIYLFIYFIKTPKIGEIHVQYMNNINIIW